jgi:hypothetical protein
VKQRPPENFSAVPTDTDGRALNVANNKRTYDLYLEWLADYLYRPSSKMPLSAALTLDEAWPRVSHIESEIAFRLWEHPFGDYPLDDLHPRHADILHRPELSAILSRVREHADRRELLHRFYRELEIDANK